MGRIRKVILALILALALPHTQARAQFVVEDPMAILQQLLTDLDLVTSGDLTLEKLMTIMEHSADMKDKIFGTASAFGEGATLYRDCIRLVDMSNRYLKVTYNNYNRLRTTYSNMEEWTGRDYAYAIGDAEDLISSYQSYYRNILSLIEALKKDSRTIEAKREALQKATEEMHTKMMAQTDSVDTIIKSEVYSSALSSAVDALDVWSDREVEAQNAIYGDTVESEKGNGQRAGSTGRFVLLIIGLIMIGETAFTAFKIFKGSSGWEWSITRLLIGYIIALIVVLVIGRYI